MTSTVVKCTTVGLMKACIAARLFSVKTLAPIEAATNMRPTKVAAAVPIKRSKSCQLSTSSANEESMVTGTGASGSRHNAGAHAAKPYDSSKVDVDERIAEAEILPAH